MRKKIVKNKSKKYDQDFFNNAKNIVGQKRYNTRTQLDRPEYTKTKPCTIFWIMEYVIKKYVGSFIRRGQTVCVFKHANENIDEWSVMSD